MKRVRKMLRTSSCWCGVILLVFFFFNVSLSPALAAGFPFKRIPFDGHVHSWYSDEDPITLWRSVRSAAQEVEGILGKGSAFAVTDHTDVIVPGVLRSLFTHAEWVDRAGKIEEAGIPVIIIPGMELTVGKKGEKTKTHGHFLVYGLKEYAGEKDEIPGLKAPFDDLKPYKLKEEFSEIRPILGHHYNLGDKVLWPIVWAGNPARKDVKEVLEEVGAAGAFGYIAHPAGKDSWTPYAWSAIRSGGAPLAGRVVKGMEIFSAGQYHDSSGVIREWDQTLDTLAGKFYCNILRQGVNFFVTGGSDNHSAVLPPRIGSSYTYLLFKNKKPVYNQDDILGALKRGHTVATLGGPFVALTVEPVGGQEITVWEADEPHDTKPAGEPPAFPGDTVKAKPGQELKITVWWEKAPAGSSIRVYSLGKGARKFQTVDVFSVPRSTGEKSFIWKTDPAGAFLIARLEKSGSIAYTSPVFIDPPGVKRPAV
ncbi:hypothetical protein, partial [Thermodesulfitimonas autotrophica]|uniref:hypothetical protein n=1 Tax=Thermodesulfitimonas autotrophica TaxID=1894989 RepID=UPI002FE2507F